MASIVGLDVSDWDGPWMNRQQILSRLAALHKVAYSRGPFHLWDRLSTEWNAAPLFSQHVIKAGVSVHIRSKLLLRAPAIETLDNVVLGCTASMLRRKSHFSTTEQSVAYVFHPSLYPLGKALKADRLVYHAYDKFSSYIEVGKQEVDLEREVVRDADVVIASSRIVANTLRDYSDREVHVVPNGADYDYFAGEDASCESLPSDLATIPKPRMAYVGNITVKVDIARMKKIAGARPDWSLVIVGGERLYREEDRVQFKELRALPNVYWLGHKKYEEVAAYVRSMDVNVLAYRVGQKLWSEACSPLKLYEYLAAGRPIVSSSLEVTIKHEDVIAIARDDNEWMSALEDAIQNGGRGTVEQRRAVAKRNTWDERIGRIEPLLLGQIS